MGTGSWRPTAASSATGTPPSTAPPGSLKLNQPVVGMAATPYVPGAGGAPASPAGLGYWLVAADGGIFNYGDAGFFGSAGGIKLNKPIVGMAPTPGRQGLLAGRVRRRRLQLRGRRLLRLRRQPQAEPAGRGYRRQPRTARATGSSAADGGSSTTAPPGSFGSAAGLKLNKPVVGIERDARRQGLLADGGRRRRLQLRRRHVPRLRRRHQAEPAGRRHGLRGHHHVGLASAIVFVCEQKPGPKGPGFLLGGRQQ